MKETLTVNETAKLLGKTPQFVRIQIQRGLLPFGIAVPSVQGAQFDYIIPRRKVYEFLGIGDNEDEKCN
mgnify:CR=1 FL=1